MAKYDWKQLEKEYILGDYKSVSSFLKSKNIKQNSNTFRHTKGWKNKKAEKVEKKGSKTVEKIIEKESEKEAQQFVDIKSIANDLALNIIKANTELNRHIATNKTKTKTVQYDYRCNKPKKETIEETEEIKDFISIIDRQGLKQLTSALKDINDILNDNKNKDNKEELDKLDEVLKQIGGVI